MASERVHDSLDKDSESVDTEIAKIAAIRKLLARVELCCPKCQDLLANGLKL